jgi:hypothetical protein
MFEIRRENSNGGHTEFAPQPPSKSRSRSSPFPRPDRELAPHRRFDTSINPAQRASMSNVSMM